MAAMLRLKDLKNDTSTYIQNVNFLLTPMSSQTSWCRLTFVRLAICDRYETKQASVEAMNRYKITIN